MVRMKSVVFTEAYHNDSGGLCPMYNEHQLYYIALGSRRWINQDGVCIQSST